MLPVNRLAVSIFWATFLNLGIDPSILLKAMLMEDNNGILTYFVGKALSKTI